MQPATTLRLARLPAVSRVMGARMSSSHTLSPQLLADLPARWETMGPADQADVWMTLRERMRGDWREMGKDERLASHYISFGPHGPRASQAAPNEWQKVLGYTLLGLGISWVLFYARVLGAREPPKTMTLDWQEKSNEYLKAQGTEAITGAASPGYTGPGMVQNVPSGQKKGYNTKRE